MSENLDTLDTTAKRIGSEFIDLSDTLNTKMEKWSAVAQRPDNLSDTECVGFLSKKESVPSGVSLLIDIQAPANTDKATLRIWGIASSQDDEHRERFNNIQLSFAMDYAAARVITQKGDGVTRDDIRAALHEPSTRLSHVVVGNQSGFDEASQQQLGQRYDITGDELDHYQAVDTVAEALSAVLATLKAATSYPQAA